MSLLAYNGVALDLLDTQGISREAVLSDDGCVYHFTRWRFDVIGVINPDATSYNAAGLPTLEQSPVVTDIVLRHRMMQPQRTLVYLVGNEVLLQTPLTGYLTDADNGPTPLHFDILEVQGMNTLVVRFVVECSVNECSGASRPIILSHRWGVQLGMDQDHYTTRTVNGVAVFRSDELLKQNKNPDQFRRDLFHPIGDNMKREGINVDVLPDGNSVRYSFVDVEQAFNLGTDSKATRVEAEQTSGMNQPNILGATADYLIDAEAGLAHVTQSLALAFNPQLSTAVSGGLLFINRHFQLMNFGRSILPTYWQSIKVRVWGDRNSRRTDLSGIAMGIAFTRLGGLDRIYATEAVLSQEITGKFVEFNMTHTWFSREQLNALVAPRTPFRFIFSGNGTIEQILQNNSPGMRPILGGFPETEDLIFGPGRITQKPVGNPAFPFSNNGRGTWLGDAVAAALQAPCSKPSAPTSGRSSDQTFR